MSRLDITWAGLSDEQQRRLGMATQLVGAHGVRVGVRDWDGTRCDALVVDLDDAYGAASMDSALRRRIRVLGFGDEGGDGGGARVMARSSPVALIARRLTEVAEAGAVGPPAVTSCLVALTEDACWHDRRAVLARGSLRMVLDRTDARAWLYDGDDRDLAAFDEPVDLDDWVPSPQPSSGPPAADRQAVQLHASVDSLLLNAAMRARAPLPRFPDGAWSLREWPDLGTAVQAIDSLRIVRALLQAPCSPRHLADTHSFAPETVDAALWAFRAAGLLQGEADGFGAPAAAHPAPPMASGLFRRLARRFGLAA